MFFLYSKIQLLFNSNPFTACLALKKKLQRNYVKKKQYVNFQTKQLKFKY